MKRVKVKTEECKRFKIFRQHLKLTQQGLADKIKKEQGTVQKYESGEVFIPSDVVKLMHDLFGMSYEWFYHGTGKKATIEVKKTLLKDIGTMQTELDQVQIEVKQLKDLIQKLYRDFYAEKHNVTG